MSQRSEKELPVEVDLLEVGEERLAIFSFPSGADLPVSHGEHRVVIELLTGRSNKVIAQALGISERTVATHVGALLRKLAVGSRAELAARLAERIAAAREAKGDA
jgi:DNA-binding CsgD family transcriptional regulator